MAEFPKVKISLSDDAWDVFYASRLIRCEAILCKFHSFNDKIDPNKMMNCTLKQMAISEDGSCKLYER